MKIVKDIHPFIIFHNSTVKDALKKINDNDNKIIFVVDDRGVLLGTVTDGDIRRFLIHHNNFHSSMEITKAMNATCHSLSMADAQFAGKFKKENIKALPLLDTARRVVAVAILSADSFCLGGIEISDDAPTFIIAEIGNNHNGLLSDAKKLIDAALDAGVNCAKFQMRSMRHLYRESADMRNADFDLGVEYTIDLLRKFSLSNDDMLRAFDYCASKGLIPLCTPWDEESVGVLENYGLEGYKVASADLTNTNLLECLAKTGKPLICSTGMSRESEIRDAANLLKGFGADVAFLHCNSTYPTPFKDVNLNYLQRLKGITGAIVGYSGHERGYLIPVAAVAMGAKLIEKHITLDRGQEGVDHKVSLLPDEFRQMVEDIRTIEIAIGPRSAESREISQGEMMNRESLAKSLVASKLINQGQIISRDMISIRSPGNGIQPNRISELIGRKASRSIQGGEIFLESDVRHSISKKQRYKFSRPYGIPVRYHDYQSMCDGIKFDFVEFHLSYSDLKLDFKQFIDGQQPIEFAIHAPELFEHDHILDLASGNENYRKQSIQHLKRVVQLAREMKPYFIGPENPIIILNAGGWSTSSFLPAAEKKKNYFRLRESLGSIDWTGLTLAIQTMPPFPWHFGGQAHHNVFVDPEEIYNFIHGTDYKVCLDVSHSMMACNYYKISFMDFLNKILPLTAHLHIVDAKGVDGEGVEIGAGDVDFSMLKNLLEIHAKDIPFVPEVWQGHKNSGEGFWKALEFLEDLGI